MFSRPLNSGENVTPEVTAQAAIIQEIQEALLGKVYGANATPETILKGYSAYVHQNLIEGTMEPGIDLLSALGLSKYAIDEVVYTNQVISSVVMNHSLGIVPKFIMILSNITRINTQSYGAAATSFSATYNYNGVDNNSASLGGHYIVKNDSRVSADKTALGIHTITDKTVTLNLGSTYVIQPGVEYTLITMA